jgi:hypothetical protein
LTDEGRERRALQRVPGDVDRGSDERKDERDGWHIVAEVHDRLTELPDLVGEGVVERGVRRVDHDVLGRVLYDFGDALAEVVALQSFLTGRPHRLRVKLHAVADRLEEFILRTQKAGGHPGARRGSPRTGPSSVSFDMPSASAEMAWVWANSILLKVHEVSPVLTAFAAIFHASRIEETMP